MNRLYLYEKKKWEDLFASNLLLTSEPAGVTEVEKGLILPQRPIPDSAAIYGDSLMEGGVCDRFGQFVAGQFRSAVKKEVNRSCIRGYEVEGEVEERDEEVIFGGMLCAHWGHLLLDSTSRLWYPVQHEEDRRKIVFILFDEREFKNQQLFSMAGLDESRYEIIEQPTRFKKIIVPDETFYSSSGHYRREWMSFFDAVKEGVEPWQYDKIYLTRMAFEKDNVIGEKYFEDYFAGKGYEVFSPEKLSIRDQVALMKGAKEIVSTTGSVSYISLFANDHIKITGLNRSKDLVRIQPVINRIKDIDGTYVDVYRNILPEHQGGNCIFLIAPETNWNKYIKDEFGDSPDASFENEKFPSLVVEYLSRWGAFFAEKSNYRFIRNFELKDVVSLVNRAINGAEIDVEDFYETAEFEKIQAQNEGMKQKLLAYKCQSLNACMASEILEEEGQLIIRGNLAVPFADHNDFWAAGIMKCGNYEKVSSAQIAYNALDERFEWESSFEINDIVNTWHAYGQRDKTDICFLLELRHDTEKKQMKILASDEVDILKASYLTENGGIIAVIDEESIFWLHHKTFQELFYEPVSIYVSSAEWVGNQLMLSGILQTPLAQDVRMVLGGYSHQYGHEDDVERQIAHSVSTEKSAPDALIWHMTLDMDEIKAAKTAPENMNIRWDPCLVLQYQDMTRTIRFGALRSAEADAHFGNILGGIGDKNVFVAGETGRGNFSIYSYNLSQIIKRFWIDQAEWEESGLLMSGKLDFKIPQTTDIKLELSILNESGESIYDTPVIWTLKGEWDVKLLLQNLRIALEKENPDKKVPSVYQMFLKISVFDKTDYLPIGSKRRPGTWDKFNQVLQIMPDYELHGKRIGKEEYMGFELIKKISRKRLGKYRKI